MPGAASRTDAPATFAERRVSRQGWVELPRSSYYTWSRLELPPGVGNRPRSPRASHPRGTVTDPHEREAMSILQRLAKRAAMTGGQRDTPKDWPIAAFSRRLWPWRERWLLALVAAVALLDCLTTYAALEMSGKEGIREIGVLGSWALKGGFAGLLLADACALTALSLAAAAARILCRRRGLNHLGRAAFVVLMLPYAFAAAAATVWNLVAGFA